MPGLVQHQPAGTVVGSAEIQGVVGRVSACLVTVLERPPARRAVSRRLHLLGIDRQDLRATVPRRAFAPSGLAAEFSVVLTPARRHRGRRLLALLGRCTARRRATIAVAAITLVPVLDPYPIARVSSAVSNCFAGFCARRFCAAFKSARAFASNAHTCSGEGP